jgi:hypothetical protein
MDSVDSIKVFFEPGRAYAAVFPDFANRFVQLQDSA